MKRILKTVSAVSIVASLAVSANAAPLVGMAIAGAIVGGAATQHHMAHQNPNAYVYYEQPQVVYQDTVVHSNGTVSSYMTTPPATVMPQQQTVITTTTQKPVAYTETTTVMPGLTMKEKTTYVRQQPTVTVVQPQPTAVIYQQQPVVNTNPVVVYY
jgi:hypothetical protein